MKVLFVANKSEAGGAPRSMMELVKRISEKYGVEYTMLVHKEGKISAFCRENNIGCCIDGHEPIVISKGSTGIRRLAKLVLRPMYILKVRKKNNAALALAEERLDLSEYDLIHTNSNRDGIGAMIAEKHNIPHVWHLREFGREDYDTVFLPPYSVDFMNKTTERFIAISDAVGKAWNQKGLDKAKITRIYNGVDVSRIQSDPDRKPLLDNKLKIVFTGTVCPAKGQNEIIEAVGRLEKEEQKLISLDFYGEGVSEYVSSLKKRAAELGFGEQVTFHGHSDDIGRVLKNYGVGVVCSRSEAFGRITPEYMAAGLIVLACDTGANPELIENGKTGFLYHRSDYNDFAARLHGLLNMTKEEKLKLSHASEKYARESFTADRNAANIYQLYCDMTEKKR